MWGRSAPRRERRYPVRVDSTPLLHKPVSYGSPLADGLFVALLVAHAAAGGGAVLAGLVAMIARKGRRLHRRAGASFVWGMVATALSGIVLDLIRLTVRYEANHVKLAGHAMPSSIPARLGFLFAALSVLYLAWEGGRRASFRRPPAPRARDLAIPATLVALGVTLTVAIATWLNPWTGALWMIATFTAAVIAAARLRWVRAAGVDRHRFSILALAGFSWWGAAQGFGPALGLLVNGDDPGTAPYTGDRPGDFSWAFFGFLGAWAPAFAVAALAHRRFARRRTAPA